MNLYKKIVPAIGLVFMVSACGDEKEEATTDLDLFDKSEYAAPDDGDMEELGFGRVRANLSDSSYTSSDESSETDTDEWG